jgi:hypothetical protein
MQDLPQSYSQVFSVQFAEQGLPGVPLSIDR